MNLSRRTAAFGVRCSVLSLSPTPNTQHPTPPFSLRRRRSRGFTLVEMIVAAMLLVIGVVAAVACIGSATNSTGIAQEYTTAALLAQQKFAEIEAQPENLSGGDLGGDFGEEYPQYSWQQTTETTDFPELVRVTLTVQWRSGLRQRTAQFATYELIPQEQQGATGQ